MLEITTGKGRHKQHLSFPNLNRAQLHCMTELTQLQMFGEVLVRRPYQSSIHPYGRKRLPRTQWEDLKKQHLMKAAVAKEANGEVR